LGYRESGLDTLQREKLDILEKSLGRSYAANDEYLFRCPKCNHHKRKLSANLSKNAFKCWICDYKGKDLAKLIQDPSLRSKWFSLTNTVDITRFEDLFTENEDVALHESLELPEYFISLTSPKPSRQALRAKKYLLDRGLTESDIIFYKIGFCFHGDYKNRVIIPSFNDSGCLNYFIARSFDNSYLKYKNPKCSKDLVFNELLIDWSEPVVLVEGFFDSVKYENSIPILGSTLAVNSTLFNKIVNNCEVIYICLDKDAAEKELKIIKKMLDFGVKICKISIDDYDDLGEVPNHLLEEYKKRASIITAEDYLLQKINFGG